MPTDLENLGLSVLFDGDYICVDADGVELKRFDLKWKALAYLREAFESEIEAQVVEVE